MESRLEDLREKEVISITDGSRLGYVGDLVIDLETGQVRRIIVPGPPRFFGLFGRGEDSEFAWEEIRRIGSDTVLVEGKPRPLPKTRQKGKWL